MSYYCEDSYKLVEDEQRVNNKSVSWFEGWEPSKQDYLCFLEHFHLFLSKLLQVFKEVNEVPAPQPRAAYG